MSRGLLFSDTVYKGETLRPYITQKCICKNFKTKNDLVTTCRIIVGRIQTSSLSKAHVTCTAPVFPSVYSVQ